MLLRGRWCWLTGWAGMLFVAAAIFGASPAGAALSVLERVTKRGHVACGVSSNLAGLSSVDVNGVWNGLDVEFCTALSVAIFGDRTHVRFIDVAAAERFKALKSGEIDVLLRGTAWTLTRDTELDARFAGILFHDGQGFMVPQSHSISSVLELSGASICVLPGSSGQRSVEDYFGHKKMRFQLVTSDKWDDLVKTYVAGGCTTLTGETSLLARERSHFSDASAHVILPEQITKEPLGPAVADGDDQWFSIVRWTLMALVGAEELGLRRDNVDAMRSSTMLDVRRFLGLEADLGAPLGLAKDWAYKIVRDVGNYAEIFDRTMGAASPRKLQRGLNDSWINGGLMYAAPFR